LFVVADAFTASARAKIEAAGGSVNLLEIPSSPLAALGVTTETGEADSTPAKGKPKADTKTEAKTAPEVAERAADEPESTDDDAEPTPKRGKATAAKAAPAKATADKGAKASAKAAKASAETDDSASEDEATPASDTERHSGDDA
jgi:hypothetical protein